MKIDETHRISRRTFLAESMTMAGVVAGGAYCHGAEPPVVTTVNDDIVRGVSQSELSMLFEGETADQCRTWQSAFRAKLNQLLGDSSPPKQWLAKEESRVVMPDHVRREFLLQAEGVPAVPIYLLTPLGLKASEKAPGVLCIHGHGKYGNDPVVGRRDLEGVQENIEKANYDYGLQFVRRGYVVAAPCMIPFGRRVDRSRYGNQDPCAVTLVRMQAMGKLPITANLRDLRWSLDFLQSRKEVAADRIGCAGLSYGGRMTMLVSAMDERIRVAAVSGALNLLQERLSGRYSCGSQIIPGLLKFGDYSEIGGLIAPRPCVWETGSTDSLIVPKWDEVFRGRLRRAYHALGAADQLHFDQFAGSHEWSGRIAFPLFDDVLKT